MTAEHKPLAERVRDALEKLAILVADDSDFTDADIERDCRAAHALIADLWSAHPQNPAAQGEARDAARYRWLRLRMNTQETVALPMGYKLDAAIDAALAVGETKGGA